MPCPREVEIENLTVHVVWSSQTGARAKHVAGGAKLMEDERVAHYWDPERRVGAAYQPHIANMSTPAWDVWMLYEPGVLWEGEAPPAPTWWEHQLSGLKDYGDLRLDPDRFARKALEMSAPGRSLAVATPVALTATSDAGSMGS